MIQSRRKFITGLVSLVAAPAIVKVSSLMPVKTMNEIEIVRWYPENWTPYNPVYINIIRKELPEAIARELCSVQPMTGALDGYRDSNS